MVNINKLPMRIAVTGITGRMGKGIVRYILNHQKKNSKRIVLGAAIARSGSNLCGMDVGKYLGFNKVGVIVTDDLKLVRGDFDILIDFTDPKITAKYLKFCTENKKNMVIGTTGLSKMDHHLMMESSRSIGIVYSANFSVGITLTLKLLEKVTCIIGNFVDIDIIETHHNKKIDVPSGTALMMRKVIKKNRSQNNFSNRIKDNDYIDDFLMLGESLSKIDRDIVIHSIRAGNIVGDHSVLFSSPEERLEITHKAFNRKIFFHGAILAASWLGTTKVGIFDLYDVLKI